MKRCPEDKGGCGQLVDMLFDSGVCQKCDAMIERGTKAARGGGAGPTDRPMGEPCGHYKKGPERGICATCGHTRAEDMAAKKSGGAGPGRVRRKGARW